jgi:hypothetical protein
MSSGLVRKIARARGERPMLDLEGHVRGQDQHRRERQRLLERRDAVQRLEPVDRGHVEVEQDHVWVVPTNQVHLAGGIPRRHHLLVAGPAQHPLQQDDVRLLIVHDEDPRVWIASVEGHRSSRASVSTGVSARIGARPDPR